MQSKIKSTSGQFKVQAPSKINRAKTAFLEIKKENRQTTLSNVSSTVSEKWKNSMNRTGSDKISGMVSTFQSSFGMESWLILEF